jgi:hypothetical protein
METPAEKILLDSYTIVEIAGNGDFHLSFYRSPMVHAQRHPYGILLTAQ